MDALPNLKAQGNDCFRSGRYGEAVRHYTDALAVTDSHGGSPGLAAPLLANRSAALLKSGDSLGALRDARACIQADPAFPKGWLRLAAALGKLEQWEAASAAQDRFLYLSGDDSIPNQASGDLRKKAAEAGRLSAAAQLLADTSLERALKEQRKASERQEVRRQYAQGLAAPAWDPEDCEWRPTLLPQVRGMLVTQQQQQSQQTAAPTAADTERPEPAAAAGGGGAVVDPDPAVVGVLRRVLSLRGELERPRQALRALRDEGRMRAYQQAIASALAEQPGSHVLVLGQGTGGALALLAAAAGAGSVTCVESNQVTYQMTRRLLDANRHVPGHANIHLAPVPIHQCCLVPTPPSCGDAASNHGGQASTCEEGSTLPYNPPPNGLRQRPASSSNATWDLASRADIVVTDLFDHSPLSPGAVPALRHVLQNLAVDSAVLLPSRLTFHAILLHQGSSAEAWDGGASWHPHTAPVQLSDKICGGHARPVSEPFQLASLRIKSVCAAPATTASAACTPGAGVAQGDAGNGEGGAFGAAGSGPIQLVDFPAAGAIHHNILQVPITEAGRCSAAALWFELGFPDGTVLASCDGSGVLSSSSNSSDGSSSNSSNNSDSSVAAQESHPQPQSQPQQQQESKGALEAATAAPEATLEAAPEAATAAAAAADPPLQFRQEQAVPVAARRHVAWSYQQSLLCLEGGGDVLPGDRVLLQVLIEPRDLHVLLLATGRSGPEPAMPADRPEATATPGPKAAPAHGQQLSLSPTAGGCCWSAPAAARLRTGVLPSWHYDLAAGRAGAEAYEGAIRQALAKRGATGATEPVPGPTTVLAAGAGSHLLAMLAARAGASLSLCSSLGSGLAANAAESTLCRAGLLQEGRCGVLRRSPRCPADLGGRQVDVLVMEASDPADLASCVLHVSRAALPSLSSTGAGAPVIQPPLLRDDAQIIPSGAQVYCMPVQLNHLDSLPAASSCINGGVGVGNAAGSRPLAIDLSPLNVYHTRPDCEAAHLAASLDPELLLRQLQQGAEPLQQQGKEEGAVGGGCCGSQRKFGGGSEALPHGPLVPMQGGPEGDRWLPLAAPQLVGGLDFDRHQAAEPERYCDLWRSLLPQEPAPGAGAAAAAAAAAGQGQGARRELRFTVAAAGVVNAVIVWLDLELAPGHALSNSPFACAGSVDGGQAPGRQVVHWVAPAQRCSPGDVLAVDVHWDSASLDFQVRRILGPQPMHAGEVRSTTTAAAALGAEDTGAVPPPQHPGLPLTPAPDPMWAARHAELRLLLEGLSKAVGQDPREYRRVAEAALRLAGRPHEHGVDADAAAAFLLQMAA